uniref:Mating-type protein MAT-1 n=2 Tax=Eutiarosporella TaxID=1660394 RepID=A0A2D1GT54_9PEZI|nr:MAT1-1-1 [Eutiarosporella darliae]ATN96246.1 MAT1-1-1 [Eutiarosporella pseudodarliae]
MSALPSVAFGSNLPQAHQGFVNLFGSNYLTQSATNPPGPSNPSQGALNQHGPNQAQVASALAQKKDKKKRSLNCFVAFRCYVSPVFDKFQQKDRSGFVREMWAFELVKSKWTIIAKAYSYIRDDVGKENAPLDGFLALACPHIGIIDRKDLLSTLGWELVNTGPHWQLIRRFVPASADLPKGYLTTDLSVKDIITFVRRLGYGVPIPAAAMHGISMGSALTMAAQPAHQAAQNISHAAQNVNQAAQIPVSTFQLPLPAFQAQYAANVPQVNPTALQAPQNVTHLAQLEIEVARRTAACNSGIMATGPTFSGMTDEQFAEELACSDPISRGYISTVHAHPAFAEIALEATGNVVPEYWPTEEEPAESVEPEQPVQQSTTLGTTATEVYSNMGTELYDEDSPFTYESLFNMYDSHESTDNYFDVLFPKFGAIDIMSFR